MIPEINTSPGAVYKKYNSGVEYKSKLGKKGLFEQTKINERFFVGDQWHGVKCGNDRPLVRRNLIKRIGEYKMSAISSAPIAVNFSAEGIPDNGAFENYQQTNNQMLSGEYDFADEPDPIEITTVMSYLSDYFKTTAERVRFDLKKEEAIKNAYISGTCVAYTYWDETVKTGLYVDSAKQNPIAGDIQFEILDIENVVFGEPNNSDVQSQPYIIISQRKMCADVKREAERQGMPKKEIDNIQPDRPDSLYVNAGTRGENEPEDSERVTVFTMFYKEYDKNGEETVKCVRTTEKATVRKPWDIKIKLYPLAKMCWETRFACAYGDSEITYLIPNQIAINRALSANIWSIMTTGMPITVVNREALDGPLTNSPGQILNYVGDPQYMGSVVQYIQPPAFSAQQIDSPTRLAENTLADSGANDAALGNIRPDNAAAIIQIREAALQPMQLYQNRFYAFIEDTARIWAEFWLHLYGDRQLKVNTPEGTAYVPFHASRYSKLLISAKVDVGAATLWSTAIVVSTLDSLLQAQIITPAQYLERMPGGIIPDKTGLIEDIKQQQQQSAQTEAELSDDSVLSQLAEQQPELYAKFQQLPPDKQQQLLQNMRKSAGEAPA